MNDEVVAICLEIAAVTSLVLLVFFPRLILLLMEDVRRSRRRENLSPMIIGIRLIAALGALDLAYKFWGGLLSGGN